MDPDRERALRAFGHDSRNLIQSALWPIEHALAEPGASPAVVAALRHSCQKLVHLLVVVDDHVVRDPLAAGALQPDPRPLDLAEAVEDLVLTLERLFPVPLRVVRPRAARPVVLADSDWVTMALRVLLLRALTSQAAGRAPVLVRIRAAGARAWAVEVRDAGPETAARLAAEGAGAADLALARALAQGLGGALTVAPRAPGAPPGLRLTLPRGAHV